MTSEAKALSAIATGYKLDLEEARAKIAALRARLEVVEPENVRLRGRLEQAATWLEAGAKRNPHDFGLASAARIIRAALTGEGEGA